MRTLILTLVMLAVPAAASAQVCPYGLVAADGAHCCWPGQAFEAERGLCVGAPQCPAGLTAYGEACVAAPAQPVEAPELPPPPPPPPSAPGYQAVPEGYVMPPPQMPMQVPAQVFGSQVRFESKKAGNEFIVSVDGGGMCRTPCSLVVPPGKHQVKVEGDARFRQKLEIPAGASLVQIEKRRGGGIALAVVSLSVGIPAAVLGGAVGLLGLINNSSSYYSYGSYRDQMYAGFGVMAAGVTLAAAGGAIGFGLAGHNRLTFAQGEAYAPKPPPVQLIGLGVAPTNGGAMAGATFAF